MGAVGLKMPFEKMVVIDARGHLMGRLASFVAKETLLGQKVVVVRCEELVISGSFIRNKLKLLMKRNKRMNTNPQKHYRGSAAFQRVKCLEGVPEPFNSIKKVVVPDALRIQRLRPGRKFSNLGKLAGDLGWGYKDIVAKYEERRKERNAEWYAKVKAKRTAMAKAKAATAK